DVEDQRRPALLLPQPRHRRGRRGLDDRRRLLPAGVPRAADGIRGRGQETAGSIPGRSRGLMRNVVVLPILLLALSVAACNEPAPPSAGVAGTDAAAATAEPATPEAALVAEAQADALAA